MKLWKVYFGFVVFTTIYGIWHVIVMPKLTDMFALIFNGVVLIGLYGFCFQRKIGARNFWKVAFFAYLFEDIIYYLFRMHALSAYLSLIFLLMVYGLTFLLNLPSYIAIYLYAFKRKDIWEKQQVSGKDGKAQFE